MSALKPCRLLIVSYDMSLMLMTYLMSYDLYLINFSYKLLSRAWSCDDVDLVLGPVMYLINFYKLLSCGAWFCDVGLVLSPVE